jgi:GxxExxY protein
MLKTKRNLIFAEECYSIMGSAFEVFNEIGSNHKEKIFQKALANSFSQKKIAFKEQLRARLVFKGKEIGFYIFDFLVFDKIVVEIKVRNYFSRKDIEQLYRYLKVKNLKLGLIIHFTKEGVKYKRVVNLK